MKCPFGCSKDENPNFDNPVEHLIMTISPKGQTHIHGPFGNEFAIRKMADSFMAELEKNGIKYVPPTQDRKED